jgi:acetyl-CoA acetyltransferase
MLIGRVLDELARTNQATGLVTKGVGDGVGIATVLERI